MYKDELLQRQVKFAHILGHSVLDEDKLAQVSNNFKRNTVLFLMNLT